MSDQEGLLRGSGLSFRLGRVPVRVPWSGVLGVLVIAFLWWGRFDLDPARPGQTVLLALVFALLFYASILGHELAHAWVATLSGYPVHSITLWVLGGYTSYERRRASALREGLVAAAGPVASLLIGMLAWLVATASAGTDLRVYVVAEALAVSNILLAIYNALPGLPLDGGAVLKSLVWGATRDEGRGTVVAAWAGRVVAVLVFVAPLLVVWAEGGQPDIGTVVVGALIGAYLFAGANEALRRARVGARVPGLAVAGLVRPAVTARADEPLSEALRRLEEARARAIVVVDHDGRPSAVSLEQAVSAVPLQRRPWVPVSSVSAALDPRATLRLGLVGEQLLRALQAFPAEQYVVVADDGALVGVLTMADVERALTT